MVVTFDMTSPAYKEIPHVTHTQTSLSPSSHIMVGHVGEPWGHAHTQLGRRALGRTTWTKGYREGH
jgi:hypothetical protein